MYTCVYCRKPLVTKSIGRVPDYCSNACRQASYRLRKNDFQRQRISSSLRKMMNVDRGAG